MDIIEIQNLSKNYGKGHQKVVALDNISISVKKNSIYGFLGPNGAGKSTTLAIMLQFLHQDSGDVYLFGQNVKTEIVNLKRLIGFIPDADLPNTEGLTLLKHTGKYLGLSGNNLKQRIREIVSLTDTKEFISRKAKKLSKGQKTKIKIANALLTDPELIIADEPTSGLDPIARREFLKIIMNLAKNEEKTVFFSNHVIGEVEKICDRITILSEGKVQIQGTIHDILNAIPVSNRFMVSAENISLENILNLPNVINVEEIPGNRFIIESSENNGYTPRFIQEIITNPKYKIHSFSRENVNLEDVFFRVVSKEESI